MTGRRIKRVVSAVVIGLMIFLPAAVGKALTLYATHQAGTLNCLVGMLSRDTSLWTDDVWVLDSTPVECGRSRETTRPSDLAGWAEYGYCASPDG